VGEGFAEPIRIRLRPADLRNKGKSFHNRRLCTNEDRKKELPKSIVAKVSAAIRRLLGQAGELVAEKCGVIQRKRKFRTTTLLQTFVPGFLKNPKATDEELARMAVQCGVEVTSQAIEQRHSPKLVRFLNEVLQEGAKTVVGSDRALAPILERFTTVSVLDGSTVGLPDSMQGVRLLRGLVRFE